MNILGTLRLPVSQYIPETTRKDLIVLHHTVGGTARGTFNHWQAQPERIGTAYLVERDGTVYRTFPDDCWAYHLGLRGAAAAGGYHERRSIGVEIASEGALAEREITGEKVLWWEIGKRAFPWSLAYTHPNPWRGYQHWAAYPSPQVASVIDLVDFLLTSHAIPRQTVRDHLSGPTPPISKSLYTDRLGFRGVLSHSDLRADKNDVHPGFPWAELVSRCRLTVSP